MSGISNFVIEKAVNEIDDDLKTNFVGVFRSTHTFKFLNFTHLIKEKLAPYPFMIMNTDRSGQEGEHWWRVLELSFKEQIFLLDSFGFIGLKEFMVDNDRKLVDRFFYGLEKINRKDKRINLTYVQFDVNLNEFGKVHKRKLVNVYMVDNQLQNLKSDTCGLFQLYFYTNLFIPEANSKIISNKTLTKKAIENLLNEIFSLNISKNEQLVQTFADEHNIKRD